MTKWRLSWIGVVLLGSLWLVWNNATYQSGGSNEVRGILAKSTPFLILLGTWIILMLYKSGRSGHAGPFMER
jgi:hypothetical protein